MGIVRKEFYISDSHVDGGARGIILIRALDQRITEFPCDIVFHLAHQVIDISIVVIAGSGRDPQPFSQLPQREIPLSFLVNQRQPFFDQLCLQISVMVWFFFHNSAFLKCFILR